jgi:predicted MFS family arabinose efflux permease
MNQQKLSMPTILAFALLPLSGFATDIYIPSLPAMGVGLQVSSIQVQFTLTLFLISYGVGQLFVGSFLDSYGRYKASIGALIIFVLASVLIARTHNIYLIYTMRIVHGLTTAIIVVAKRAYFVDTFKGEQLKHYLSLFTIIWSAGPIMAPFIGGYLQSNFGWASNFYFLAIFAAVILVLELIYSKESLQNRMEFRLKTIVRIYGEMFKTGSFTLGLFMLGCAYSMVMIYNMTGPFIIEHHLGLSPIIAGDCSLILGLAWMAGGFIGKATIRYPFLRKLTINIILQAIFIIAMIISTNFVSTVYSLVLFAFLVHVCAGNTYNNYFTYCLGRFPQNAGIAGGLTGGCAYIILSVLTYGIANVIPAKDESNLAKCYLILVILSGIAMLILFRLNKNEKKVHL